MEKYYENYSSIEYGKPVENIPINLLTEGDYIRTKTKSGSVYNFEVQKNDQGEMLVFCCSGNETLKGRGGILWGDISKGKPLKFGEGHTSALSEIVLTTYPPLEYNKPLTKVGKSDLEVGDYLNLNTASDSKYVFRVISRYQDDVYLEFFAGKETLQNVKGALSNKIIKVGEALYCGGGRTSPLAGIIVTKQPLMGFVENKSKANFNENGDFKRANEKNDDFKKGAKEKVKVKESSLPFSRNEIEAINLLGLDENNFTKASLLKAFREFSKLYHPDRLNNKSTQEQVMGEILFKSGSEGYDLLLQRFK